MQDVRGQIFCQRCRAANSIEQELCSRCGTRLMLVVEPSATRFEGEGVAGGMEEHLLERVTNLENHLTRFADKLERVIDLMLRQSRSSYQDHVLVNTLIEALGEAKAINRRKLESAWRERCERDAASFEEKSRRNELCERVLASYKGHDSGLFARLVKEGFSGLGDGKKSNGVRSLERAAAMAAENAPLNAFLGEHFFREGKLALARDYLSRSLSAEPADGRVWLLLGLVCGERGDAARSREHLTEAVRLGAPSFAAHFALGRLAAAESDWKSALAEFKRALAARPCAEAHYLLALAYFKLERHRTALRHLLKALEEDPHYAEAFYLLGLVQLRLGERDLAAESFDAARAADPDEPRYGRARKSLSRPDSIPLPPLLSAAGPGKRRLLTGGDKRLSAVLQEDALGGLLPR